MFRIGYELFIDDESSYRNKNIRSYLLNNFNITGKIVSDDLKFNNYTKNVFRKFKIRIDKFKKYKEFLIEATDTNKQTSYHNYLNNILLNQNVYLEGHFESEKYFINERDKILNEFKLTNENQYKVNKYLYNFHNENIVSICVRQNRFSESIGNKSNFYGKGFGTIILGLAIKRFIKSYKPKKIFSIVKKSNKRSEKCFLNNQFIKVKKNTPTKINLKNVNYFQYKFN